MTDVTEDQLQAWASEASLNGGRPFLRAFAKIVAVRERALCLQDCWNASESAEAEKCVRAIESRPMGYDWEKEDE